MTDSLIEQNQITLKRVTWNEEAQFYEETDDDQIMSTEQVRTGTNVLSPAMTDRYETIRQIAVKDDIDRKSMKCLTPKEVLFEGDRTITVPEQEQAEKRYYVYAQGDLAGIFTKAGDAVKLAY